ncbi:MAG: MraY family glycosyltransferase [Candidatus Omnitrophica bacterium]|nr:MraY family glycosyltransferase [Candidatus Omnitrophota bacterium]
MNIPQIIETFFIAIFVSYLIMPFVRQLAMRLNYLDHPKNNKVHAHPTPLLGGLGIFAAFLIAIVTKEQVMAFGTIKAIMFGSFILFIIGLIDDKMGMMPNFKLLGQFVAAMIAVKAGLRVEFIDNYYLSVIITYLWIIGITNAFNLLDNMNGLSAGIAAIAAIFFGIISYMNGQPLVTTISLAVAGASLGFLRYNFPRASIFMGDSGSLVLGYILSTIAILGSWKTYAWTTSLMVPILILGYPIFDTALVTIMRTLEGRSIFKGGKDHSSHRLALLGFKRYRTVLAVYGICILLGLAAVAVTRVRWIAGTGIGLAAFAAMLAFGLRLSFVDTKQFGRKKGANDSHG